MQLNIPKIKILLCASMIFLISSCSKKSNLENQIAVKINSIDSKTKQFRINTFDTIEVRKESIGYLMKTFDKVGEYVTDSTGSVTIKVDPTENYHIILKGPNIYGSVNFAGRALKDDQEVDIEVISLENR